MAKGHKDKIAIITGAAGGIGQAFAKRLAEDGVHIAIADLGDGAATVKMVEAAGRKAVAIKCDVSEPQSVTTMANEVKKHFGHADIVVNCAGIFPQRAFTDMTYDDWRKVMSINLDSAFLVASAFAPGMIERKWGRIVNMASSTFGLNVSGYAHYIASKGGIIGLTRALASELGPHGVTVNCIAPTLTRTPGALTRGPRADDADMEASFARAASRQAIPRTQTPADLVGTVSFLTSDDAAFCTGQTMYVNGGLVRS